MKHPFSARTLLFLAAILLVSIAFIVLLSNRLKPTTTEETQAVAIKSVSSQIQADGAITAQDQATLHFQAGGKLVYLPFKEGDSVKQGQTIASLDTTTIQKQITQALNS